MTRHCLTEGRILVTGATGFVGKTLCHRLADSGRAHRRIVRVGHQDSREDDCVIEDIKQVSSWSAAFQDVFAVVHLAARVHVLRDRSADPLEAFRDANVTPSRTLFEAASKAGVKKFVFVSSIKAMGEKSARPFSEIDVCVPEDPYGFSKLEAERVLTDLARNSDMALTILRPPLMYGPGVKGNFLSLLGAVDRGIPLPVGSIDNRRSLLFVGNLADAVVRCVDSPRANGRTYLLSDCEDLSTPDLVRHIADALKRKANIAKFPLPLLRLLGRLTARSGTVDRLTGSLQVDASRIREDLGWTPPTTFVAGLSQTAKWFIDTYRS
jgi:nucleoside-diphosphate-sugar epimerase